MVVRAEALSLFGIAQTAALGTADLGMDDRGRGVLCHHDLWSRRDATGPAARLGGARDDNSRYGHRWGLELPIVPLQTPRLGLLLVAATTVAVFTVDMLAGGLIAICFAFLPYDFAWTKALAKLNPHLSLESGQ